MRARLTGMTVGLAVGITAAVSIASAVGAYLFSLRHSETLLDTARASALAQAELIRGGLEHGMMEDSRTLIERMIRAYGREPGVLNVMLLDRDGVVQFSSGQHGTGDELSLESPTCQACHQYPAAERASSRVLEARGGAILRTVVPFHNHVECQQCHDPGHAINGVLISDLDATEIRAAASRDVRWMVTVSGVTTLLLLTAIGVVVRLVVLRRLQKFETVARQISQGDLSRRVPVSGSDTIAWLGREFNAMADAMGGLVGQVRSERERLETVINSIDDGIVVLDSTRRVVAANDAFLARTGGARAQLVGCSCQGACAGGCSVGGCPTVACLDSGQRQVRIVERRRPDGSTAWEEVHASPVAGGHGSPSLVVEVWRDISDRRAAEARLAESHRLASLGLLASGFSHELNTPLATVLACVEGIVREAREPDAASDWAYVQESASTARDQILRCRGITQQFLRMSRGQPSAPRIVDVHDAVTTAVRLITPAARDRHVALHADPGPSGSLRVLAEESELQHVLINVLLNAVQACRSGGAVHIQASREAPQETGTGPPRPPGAAAGHGHVVVVVSDDGCGIAWEHQPHIFEPFFSARDGGTGLGLFMSLNFVRQCGGDIGVRSTPGAGSTFSIVLPQVSESTVAVPA
jgi:PAS domain S-box-containing protein